MNYINQQRFTPNWEGNFENLTLNEYAWRLHQGFIPIPQSQLVMIGCIPTQETFIPGYNIDQFCQCEEIDFSLGNNCNPHTIDEVSEYQEMNEVNHNQASAVTTSKKTSKNRISDANLRNLELLKEYSYDSEHRTNSKSGKKYMVYICKQDDCRKEFLRTWNLLDHLRMHQGVKPYVCQFCSKSFTQKCNLRKHVYRHYNPMLESRRRYTCKFCSSKFTERYNYKTHLRKKHGLRNIDNKRI